MAPLNSSARALSLLPALPLMAQENLRVVKPPVAMSPFSLRQLDMTHVLAAASCKQVSDSVVAVYQKIFAHLWHALKNLVQIKRWNSYVKSMPLTCVHVNA